MNVLMLIVGLLLLAAGAEMLVRGASRTALAAGISPLVVGLTVVAYGTSAPELVVSVQAAFRGQTDVALGNVIGSNIFNILVILGLSALIVPLSVHRKLVRFDVPLMIGLSVLLLFLSVDGRLGPTDGLILILALACYTFWLIRQSRRENATPDNASAERLPRTADADGPGARRILLWVLLIVGGLALLILGARWFTNAAVDIARGFGVSELVIGLTLVAAGTSLPELATSAVAALRGERDIAVGNVVGSNLFNIMGVVGFAGVLAPLPITISPAALYLDLPIMIGVAVVCLPIFFTGHAINRWEGAVFLVCYVAYTAYLILAETHEFTARTLAFVALGFVLPLAVIALIAVRIQTKQKSEDQWRQ